MMAQRTGVIKSIALVAGFVSVLGIAIYPIIIDPKLHPEKYRDKQKWLRDQVPLEKTQPGGMKVWTDPFDRKKNDKQR